MSCFTLFNSSPSNKLSFTCNNLFQINFCIFLNLGSVSENGGGIYLSSTNSNCIIENSIFNYCYASNGGSFYISDSDYINVNFNCFSYCFSNNYGQSFYSTTPKNHFYNDNSIEYCSEKGDKGRGVTYILYGIQIIHKTNLTRNKVSSYEVLVIALFNEVYSNFNNLINNNATIAINLHDTQKGNMSFTNVISIYKVVNGCSLVYNAASFLTFTFYSTYFSSNFQDNFLYQSNTAIFFFDCNFIDNSFNIPLNIIINNNLNKNKINFNPICLKKFKTIEKNPKKSLFLFLIYNFFFS